LAGEYGDMLFGGEGNRGQITEENLRAIMGIIEMRVTEAVMQRQGGGFQAPGPGNRSMNSSVSQGKITFTPEDDQQMDSDSDDEFKPMSMASFEEQARKKLMNM
jgi:hypothetical protein